jgi:hypothetical protein
VPAQPPAPSPPHPPPLAAPKKPSIANFQPSRHGFQFKNDFRGSPLPDGLQTLGAALGAPDHFGLCGGMSAAAADLFLAGRPAPALSAVPGRESPLFQYLYRRQVNSMGPGFLAAPMYALWGRLPDGGPLGTRALTQPQLSRIAATLREGRPAVVGLVLVDRRGKPWDNHQVLATRVSSLSASTTQIAVYDSNYPGNDGLALRCTRAIVGFVDYPGPLTIRVPVLGTRVSLVQAEPSPARGPRRELPVRGFFDMGYQPARPPATLDQ